MFNSLLPPNRTPAETQIEQTLAGKYDKVRLDPDIIRKLHEPYECPIEFLPWLAYAVSVDVWDDNWEEAKKRRVIAASVAIHRKKGTVGAVRATLEALGLSDFAIKESFNDAQVAKGYFYVDVAANDPAIDSPIKQAQAIKAIDAVKKLSAHYAVRAKESLLADAVVSVAVVSIVHSDSSPRYAVNANANANTRVEAAGHLSMLTPAPVAANSEAVNALAFCAINQPRYRAPELMISLASRGVTAVVEGVKSATLTAVEHLAVGLLTVGGDNLSLQFAASDSSVALGGLVVIHNREAF